jgi:hypothetical protein
MKRAFIILVAAALLGVLAVGFVVAADLDWGMTLDNAVSPRVSTMLDEPEWEEEFVAALWARVFQQSAGGGTWDLTVQGSYTYNLEQPYIFDVDLLRFTGVFPRSSVLELTAGRFVFQDATGLILNHAADGLRFGFLFPKVQIHLGAAYTGLLLNPSSDIRVSDDDLLEVDDSSTFFGPSRVLLQGSFNFPAGRRYQMLTLQALAQFDLRADAAEEIHTQYLGLATSRRLSPTLYLDSHFTLSSGQSTVAAKDTFLLSFLYGFGFRYFNENLISSRAHLKIQYSSGFLPLVLLPGWEALSLEDFRPINQPITGLVFSPGLGNLMYADFLYTFRPFFRDPNQSLANIQPGLAVRTYFRSTFSDISLEYVDTSSKGMYLGTEIEANLVARVFSDLGLSLRTGVFLPGTGGFGVFTVDRKPEFLAKVEISTSL